MKRLETTMAGTAGRAALACVLAAACAAPAWAAETGGVTTMGTAEATSGAPATTAAATHNVTFICATADGSVAFSGEKFSVWRVADETGAILEAFEEVRKIEDEAQWAAALAAAAKDVEPDATFASNGSGTAALALEHGEYLVVGAEVNANGTGYRAVPYVMDLTDKTLLPDLTSYVKYTTDGTAPTPPDDGTDKDNKNNDGNSGTSGNKTTTTGAGSAVKTGLAVTGDAVTLGAALACAGASVAAALAARKKMKTEDEEGAQ